jgi:hypothetical protein
MNLVYLRGLRGGTEAQKRSVDAPPSWSANGRVVAAVALTDAEAKLSVDELSRRCPPPAPRRS